MNYLTFFILILCDRVLSLKKFLPTRVCTQPIMSRSVLKIAFCGVSFPVSYEKQIDGC